MTGSEAGSCSRLMTIVSLNSRPESKTGEEDLSRLEGVEDRRLPRVLATRRTSRGSLARNVERHETKFTPGKALKLIVRGKLTFDTMFVLHRLDTDLPRLGGVEDRRLSCVLDTR